MKLFSKVYFHYKTKILEHKYRSLSDCDSFIMFFHDIVLDQTDCSSFKCNVNDFKKILEHFIKVGYQFVNPNNVFKGNKRIALSFDDCFESVYDLAFPILKELQIPFTLFISYDLLNKEKFISYSQLFEFSKESLCTIGAHSLSHPMLRYCKTSKIEISESKQKLESLVKRNVDLFAYPFGSVRACGKRNINEVRKAKYKYAFSTINGFINKNSIQNEFFLPRINGDKLVKEILK